MDDSKTMATSEHLNDYKQIEQTLEPLTAGQAEQVINQLQAVLAALAEEHPSATAQQLQAFITGYRVGAAKAGHG